MVNIIVSINVNRGKHGDEMWIMYMEAYLQQCSLWSSSIFQGVQDEYLQRQVIICVACHAVHEMKGMERATRECGSPYRSQFDEG